MAWVLFGTYYYNNCSLTHKIQKMQNRGKCRKKYKNAIKTA